MTKKYKIITTVCAAAFAAVAVFGGCSSSEDNGSAPEVDGAHDIECLVNSSVDLLDGVSALDYEDGDITPSMKISVSPEAEVSDGYAVFSEEGSYRVTYTIEDSDGNTSYDTAIVTAVDRETYLDFVSVNGFRGVASGRASLAKNGMYDGVYIIEAAGSEIAEDVQITRTYSMYNGKEYTFTYGFDSTAGGRAYIYAGDTLVKEIMVSEGSNTVTFTYTSEGTTETTDVEISLMAGSLGDSFTINMTSASYGYPQTAGLTDLLEGFTFNTANSLERFDGTAGSVSVDGTSATLEITSTTSYTDGIWRGGMFITTGVETKAGMEYTVSFDIVSTEANLFEVVIQHKQWDEDKYETVSISDGTTLQHVERTFTVANGTAGDLWLYVQSGTNLNTITISNLSVTSYSDGGLYTESLALNDFTAATYNGYEGYLTTNGGSFTFTIPEFSSTDSDQQVLSPDFYVSGSGSNYRITFRAKATKPVVTVFAAPVSGGWDPTLAWERITITEEEQVFTIWCSDNGGNTNYLVWQFGSSSNLKYKDVTIEITDIRICYKSSTLD